MKKKIKLSPPIMLPLFRLILAPFILAAILQDKTRLALILFIFIALTSIIDSILNKKRKSQLRSIIDPLADKLLINLTAISLFIIAKLPLWVMLTFIVKDTIISLGSLVLIIRNKSTIFKENIIGKITLFFQALTLIMALLGQLDEIITYISVGLTAVSLIYTTIKSDFKLPKRKKQEYDAYKITKLLKVADFLTLGNVLSGLVAILAAINGTFTTAAIFLLIAVVFDYFDGKVARWMKNESDFGKELDSLADTISFGVAPAVFGFSIMQVESRLSLQLIAIVIFLFCGILRLARYNIMEVKGAYSGLPITFNGAIIPLVFFLNMNLKFYPYIYLILGILMVSNFKLRKVI